MTILHLEKDGVTILDVVMHVLTLVISEEEGGQVGAGDTASCKSFDVEELKVLRATPPKTLGPAAADAFLMFQVCS